MVKRTRGLRTAGLIALVFAFSACGETPTETSLTVDFSGTGGGTVLLGGDALGQSYSGSFIKTLERGQTVALSAVPNPSSSFAGWGEACAGSGAVCYLEVDANKRVSATFTETNNPAEPSEPGPTDPGPDPDPTEPDPTPTEPEPSFVRLTPTFLGTGEGRVTDDNAQLDCRSSCAADYLEGATVTLRAEAAAGSSFSGWGGSCASASSNACILTLTEDTSVEATFDLQDPSPTTFQLVVDTTGEGTGTVSSSPGQISCGAVCAGTFAAGTDTSLTAVAATGSEFAGWLGCSSASETACQVTLTEDLAVSAHFVLSALSETTVRVPIRTGSDDAEQYLKPVYVNTSKYKESFVKDAVDIKSGDIDLVHDKLTDADQIVGLRFSQVPLPKGAVITNAYIQFQSDEDYTNRKATTLYFEVEANTKAAPFVHQAVAGISGRTKTGAKPIIWTPAEWGDEGVAGEAERSPNLAGLLQQVIDYPSWDPTDNAVAFIISGSGYRAATSFEDSDGQAELVVTYR